MVVKRGAQFVAGVGDEPAHPLVGSAGLFGGGLQRRDRSLDLGQHSVERQRQSTDLGAGITLGDATVGLPGRTEARSLGSHSSHSGVGVDNAA
jgi:hypothetical protein